MLHTPKIFTEQILRHINSGRKRGERLTSRKLRETPSFDGMREASKISLADIRGPEVEGKVLPGA